MKRILFASVVVFALSTPSVFADHHKGPMREPSKEERAKMAEMHSKMAECLKSDKSMKDCHKEMMDSCKDSGEGMCPMMRPHHGPHGKDKAKSGDAK